MDQTFDLAKLIGLLRRAQPGRLAAALRAVMRGRGDDEPGGGLGGIYDRIGGGRGGGGDEPGGGGPPGYWNGGLINYWMKGIGDEDIPV